MCCSKEHHTHSDIIVTEWGQIFISLMKVWIFCTAQRLVIVYILNFLASSHMKSSKKYEETQRSLSCGRHPKMDEVHVRTGQRILPPVLLSVRCFSQGHYSVILLQLLSAGFVSWDTWWCMRKALSSQSLIRLICRHLTTVSWCQSLHSLRAWGTLLIGSALLLPYGKVSCVRVFCLCQERPKEPTRSHASAYFCLVLPIRCWWCVAHLVLVTGLSKVVLVWVVLAHYQVVISHFLLQPHVATDEPSETGLCSECVILLFSSVLDCNLSLMRFVKQGKPSSRPCPSAWKRDTSFHSANHTKFVTFAWRKSVMSSHRCSWNENFEKACCSLCTSASCGENLVTCMPLSGLRSTCDTGLFPSGTGICFCSADAFFGLGAACYESSKEQFAGAKMLQ